jgi:intein/homing endonuclease
MENIIIGRSNEDLKEFGDRGTAFIGKHIVGEGEESHLTNSIYMDVIRPHVVLVSGKRGSGKCVEENTLVTLDDGSVVPIKELEKKITSVYGLNEKLKVSSLNVTKFYKRKVSKLLRIRTRGGKEIKLTPEHPLLTVKGWKDAKELGIGSRIATPRKIEVFGNNTMKECEIKLLAYMIAEGHIKNELTRFTNTDELIVNDFRDSIEKFDSSLKMVYYRKDSFGISQIKKKMDLSEVVRDERGHFAKGSKTRSTSNSMVTWLRKLNIYDKLSSEKYIPDGVFSLPKEQISLFLNRLFSCDGSIYQHKTTHSKVWEISYSSSSEKLIRQVQHLLLRYEILSKLRYKTVKCNGKKFNVFELEIGTDNVERFIEEIGFFGKKKHLQERCFNEIRAINRNPNTDTIPKEIWDIYRPHNWAQIGREIGYSIPKGLRTSINYAPSRQKLLQISSLDQNSAMQMIARSDIFWDEIVLMEELEGEFNVCDISVPVLHNFIANDMVVHNSYSAGVLAEEMTKLPMDVRKNLSVIFIDTMGIYWSMKSPNEKERNILTDWKLKPAGLNIRFLSPKGFVKEYEDIGVKVDYPLTVACSDMNAVDWIITFDFSPIDSHGIAINRIIKNVKRRFGKDYSMDDIIDAFNSDQKCEPKIKNALVSRFSIAKDWGIFERTGTPVKKLFERGKVSVLDISHFTRTSSGWSVRSMLIGLLARKIFQERLVARKSEEYEIMGGAGKDTIPMVWIMVDEAHQFIPSEGKTPATRPMLTLIKEGREPGISLVLITQRPEKLHSDALAQSDIVLSHRLTSRADIEALRSVTQTYMLKDIQEYMNKLPKQKGSAIILDDNSERIHSMQVRPRFSWHAGGSPSAIKKKGFFD